jgi:hypothetical protein
VKKEKQLDERKLCSFFAKPQKQIGGVYFSSITKWFYTIGLSFNHVSKDPKEKIKTKRSLARSLIILVPTGFV